MAIFKTYITPGKTLDEVTAFYEANPEYSPASTNPKRIWIKSVEQENGDLHETEVWDCTEEEHESNGWGFIPKECVEVITTVIFRPRLSFRRFWPTISKS